MGVIYGIVPSNLSGHGYGYGSGSGYGDGSGDGSGDGDGSGYGYGYGDGYGYGYGYGYGDGDGYGSGYGSGDGDGYGDGYGYGSGYGYGYGDGYGYGSGYGYGYGYGDGYGSEYLKALIASHVPKAKELEATGAVLAFWRSGKDGKPCNGGKGDPRHVGMIEKMPGPLVPCQAGALHATMNPPKWKGERLWIVALHPPVTKVDEDKYASLKREILAEIPNFFE